MTRIVLVMSILLTAVLVSLTILSVFSFEQASTFRGYVYHYVNAHANSAEGTKIVQDLHALCVTIHAPC